MDTPQVLLEHYLKQRPAWLPADPDSHVALGTRQKRHGAAPPSTAVVALWLGGSPMIQAAALRDRAAPFMVCVISSTSLRPFAAVAHQAHLHQTKVRIRHRLFIAHNT